MQCVAVCCSVCGRLFVTTLALMSYLTRCVVLQCVAVCCSVLQCCSVFGKLSMTTLALMSVRTNMQRIMHFLIFVHCNTLKHTHICTCFVLSIHVSSCFSFCVCLSPARTHAPSLSLTPLSLFLPPLSVFLFVSFILCVSVFRIF